MAFSSDTNVISLWAMDWDLSASKQSEVYTYAQIKDSNDVKIDNINEDSFHILYYNINKFANDPNTQAYYKNNMSSSVYSDG